MSMSIDMYNTILFGEDWSSIFSEKVVRAHKLRNLSALQLSCHMSVEERAYTKGVDFRMHTTYSFFSFICSTFSSPRTQLGRLYGIEVVRVIQGQLIESWRMRWNESNKRMYRRIVWLLDRAYNKLARPFGPPPLMIAAIVFAAADE